MSSMKRSQMMGCVPVQVDSASASTLSMNKFARVGATGVPMATPFSCLKCVSAKPNVFSLSMRSISFNMFFLLFSVELGDCVGIACWRAMLIPKACGMDGYRLFTSRVASVSFLCIFFGRCSVSRALITCVELETSVKVGGQDGICQLRDALGWARAA